MTSWTRGHRFGSHTADLIIEAWGPDRVSCIEEALYALVDVFTDRARSVVSRTLPFTAQGTSASDLLVAALEETLYLVDAMSVVPVTFRLAEAESDDAEAGISGAGIVTGETEVAEAHDVELIGPVPKAVSYHGLEMTNESGSWRCRAVVDV